LLTLVVFTDVHCSVVSVSSEDLSVGPTVFRGPAHEIPRLTAAKSSKFRYSPLPLPFMTENWDSS